MMVLDHPNPTLIESGLVTAIQTSGSNITGVTLLRLTKAHTAPMEYFTESLQVDEPRPDLLIQAVSDISLVNTGGIAFQGSSLYEFPPTDAFINSVPYLVVMEPELTTWSKGGQPQGELTERGSDSIEPNWDIECFALWDHTLEDPHYTDVIQAKNVMLRTWIQHDRLGASAPTCWFTQPYGFRRQYMYFDDRKEVAWICLRWVIRCIENLLVNNDPLVLPP